ncbi:acyltransferase [Hymenobacter sp. RP-2-7]|uniref:Acyltransferase n=1 Tax=Hymenobacter polaris TaxID=2682546 RepID=A0A7Y0FLN8_9BACT|nr:acyltransferase [Hymenobacter polaris]NML64665.1 acyltransferase [Hymenobacter polaris]
MYKSDGLDYKLVLVDNNQTKRILELDGLRAFAVALVVLYHMIDIAGITTNINPFLISLIAILGQAGVHIFFVISGFIITSLLLKEVVDSGTVSLIAFYRRRFFRIIPPLAAYLLILLLLFKIGYITIKPINFLLSFLFIGNFEPFGSSDSANGWFFGHTWSLSVEEQFYLIIPFVMVRILKFNTWLATFLLIICFVFCLLSLKVAKEASTLNSNLMGLTIFYAFRYIIIGVLFALNRNEVQKIIKERIVLLPVCLILFILVSNFLNHMPGFVAVCLSGLEAICYGFLVLWFVENPEKCAALRWGWIQWLGACSYSIYLWQQLFTGKPFFYNGWTIAQSPYAILAIIGCAALSHYLIELPSSRLGRVASKRKLYSNSNRSSLAQV